MKFGKMYWMGGKRKIIKKVEYLAEAYPLENVKYVEINYVDAKREGLSDGEYINNLKIKLSGEVLSNHFWFIEENNAENRHEFEKSTKINSK